MLIWKYIQCFTMRFEGMLYGIDKQNLKIFKTNLKYSSIYVSFGTPQTSLITSFTVPSVNTSIYVDFKRMSILKGNRNKQIFPLCFSQKRAEAVTNCFMTKVFSVSSPVLFPLPSSSVQKCVLLPRYRRWSDAACPFPP